MVVDGMMESFDGTKLHFRKDIPEHPKAVVVIVHGLCEHLGRYEYLTGKLFGKNFSVYRFDHRGHAQSEGKRVFYQNFHELADDVNAVVQWAADENPNLPVFLIGHSMGGLAVTLFGTKYPGKVKGIVLSGALTRYNLHVLGELPLALPADTYVPNALGDGVCGDPDVIEAYGKDPLVEKQISIGLMNCCYYAVEWLKENPRQFTDPVLILHGCRDGLVSEKDSRDFFGEIASEDKSLKIYAQLCHEIFNEKCRDEVMDEAIAWLEKRV
ncbi:lysophospholipase [Hydrogenispora ethanolica]|uniref:Lysophospholipase n=1 Tax=Hydrogenispora ethanolica TaxID=1082276 RepID=A0A4R1QK43_HYDET|nr:alpha/beta hydrolase [Hydrogenispora ethanolica]TCL54029.1 lysophospholipase [Hydrogenispora ethanolica]